ncbi:Gluconate utilization system GNT-I transcriptional repressor [Leclercia adecarboxylata]|uniref:Gluconate utilization system GNT-I transcriptional repressor n=1 Tax=Leclercia adecarboxylata TaxID=83655 RepID=A0A4U9ITI6_9ENTR|nr:Gluconate utilization system GNT-I transcriptional repressor [Leclercia adecarboxylata]
MALRGKIAAALDELGYIPNRAPDILSNATSRAVGVLLPSLTNQVFAEVLRGIESVTDAFGYQTMLAHYGTNRNWKKNVWSPCFPGTLTA